MVYWAVVLNVGVLLLLGTAGDAGKDRDARC